MLRKLIPLTILAVILSACSQISATGDEIKSAKRSLIASDKNPTFTKVIALSNGSAEILSAMGLKSIIIGRDIASTGADLQKIPIVTSGHQVVPEKIIQLHPDLVLVDSTTGPQQAIDLLKQAGIAVVKTAEAWSVSDIPAKVESVARAVGVTNVVANSESTAYPKIKAGTRILFLYLRGGSAIYLIGGKGSGADSLIQAMGGIDAGAETFSQPFNSMTSESLIATAPDILLVMSKGLASVGGVQGLKKLPGLEQSKAKVVAVDDSLLLSFGPRTADLIVQLANSINKLRNQ